MQKSAAAFSRFLEKAAVPLSCDKVVHPVDILDLPASAGAAKIVGPEVQKEAPPRLAFGESCVVTTIICFAHDDGSTELYSLVPNKLC